MKLTKILVGICMIIVSCFVFYFFIYPTLKKEQVVVIPSVVGLTEDDGIKILKDNNVKYKINYQEGKGNEIIKTIPKEGTIIKESYVIDLYIEQNIKRVQNLIGMKYDLCDTLLESYKDLGIEIKIESIIDNTIDEGIIVNQTSINEEVSQISSITIIISKNDDLVIMPDFYLQRLENANIFTKEHGLTLKPVFLETMHESGYIIGQEIPPYQKLKAYSKKLIVIYVSS